jgi:hypothetical protein
MDEIVVQFRRAFVVGDPSRARWGTTPSNQAFVDLGGGAQVGRAQVGGAQVGGSQVDGAQVDGTRVGGVSVGGAQVGGAQTALCSVRIQ